MALSQLSKDAGDANLLAISYHTWSGYPFYNSYAIWRANSYGVGTTAPWTWADGTLNLRGSYSNVRQDSAVFADFYNQRRAISSPLSITISGRYNYTTRTGRVKATVTNTGTSQIINHRLYYALVQTIHYHWGSIGADSCWQICRKMVPDNYGVTISLLPSETKADSQNFTIDSTAWVDNKVMFVVFVQNTSTRQILQGAGMRISSFSGVESGESSELTPEGIALAQNRPNPFKGSADIAFSLPKAENVRLAVYDAQGRLVRTLVEGNRSAGTNQVSVSGLKSGVYFYRLEAGKTSLTRRMVVAK